MGCSANPRRALEARNRRQSIYGREVHGPTAKATVSDVAYLPRQPCDATDGGGLLVVPTATCRLLFVLVILAHDRRRVVHTAVTARPNAAWTAQQFRRAFPWDQAPRFLIHDRDLAFQAVAATVKGMGTEEVLTAPHSPWQNAYAERFIGSVRRGCLDHVIVLNAAGLRKILKSYVTYYSESRTHLALEKDAPQPRLMCPTDTGPIVAVPQVGGLHHRCDRRAA